MKNSLLVSLMVLFTISSNAQKNIPAAVKTAFAKQFPDAKNIKWEKENNQFEAGFKTEKGTQSALFNADGTMTESEIEIDQNTLPKEILEYVAKHYKGIKIKGAAKINSVKDGTLFEAEIKGKDLLFDANGKFIKEIIE